MTLNSAQRGADAAEVSSVQVIRGERIRSRGRAKAVFVMVLGVITAFWTAVCFSLDPTRLALLPFVLFLGAMAYGCFRFAVGARRADLTVDDQRVVVRNPWRTVVVPTTDVARFEAGIQEYVFGLHPDVLLVLRDGTRIPVWTLARETPRWTHQRSVTRWEPVAAELNALLPAAPHLPTYSQSPGEMAAPLTAG